jgi:hypothetical protein
LAVVGLAILFGTLALGREVESRLADLGAFVYVLYLIGFGGVAWMVWEAVTGRPAPILNTHLYVSTWETHAECRDCHHTWVVPVEEGAAKTAGPEHPNPHGTLALFDPSGLRPGQRVRIGYRHRTPYVGVRGRVLRIGPDDVVIQSDKSGAEVRVLFENIADVEALTEPPVDRVAANQEGTSWMASIVTPSRQEAPPRGQIDESVRTPAAAESHAVVPAPSPLVVAPLSPAVVEPATVAAPSWQPTTDPPPIEASESERSVFYCPRCGNARITGMRFCAACGTDLDSISPRG